ncbi:MAG: GTP-binding protein [Bacteroidetes bacterium]|nr:MAG: GTP-binding protein [Bacteroidota bacterium]
MKEGFQLQQIKERIPVTIITGFLGAGKTTFLNHILLKYKNTRFVIIENEFGELGVDGDLLINENIPVYELVNGCICCSLNNDFYSALQLILEKPDVIDHLLIETTGIADPSQVIDLFISNEHIRNNFIVNSVICLTDSTLLATTLDNEPEAIKQIALSDIVMLNKIDLLQSAGTEELKTMISEINPMAEILETSHAHTNGSPILSTKAYSCQHIEQSTLSFDNLKISLSDIFKNNHHNGVENIALKHTIRAEGFLFNECFDKELFNIWISSLIYFNQNSLYRAKGILYFKNSKKKYIFQAVKGSCVFEEGSEWKEGESRFSKIVFIGKFIDRSEMENKLEKLFVKHETQSV